MRRKIAFFATLLMTVALMIARLVDGMSTEVSLSDPLLGVSLVAVIVLGVLCFSEKRVAQIPEGTHASVSGWICTFCGAVLIMSVILDVFCWAVYGQVPPPNSYILNSIDHATLIMSLLFGIVAGGYMVVQGFCWMARSQNARTALAWLSLTPVLWMWFRLARYEISYASTIDISKSFFDFTTLIFASLFFLQLCRLVASIGKPPKNSLLLFALCTAMISLSGAPVTMYNLANGEPIGKLMIAVVDVVVGLFALSIAAAQVFSAPVKTTAADELAWTDDKPQNAPVEPTFHIDDILPTLSAQQATETDGSDLTVDAILSEIEKKRSL